VVPSAPVRIPPLPESEWDSALAEIVASFGPLNVVTTLGRYPQLCSACSSLGSMLLFSGTLPARCRELAILRTAYRSGCAYEQEHHERLGAEIGLTRLEISALSADAAGQSWAALDHAVITAADELCDTSTLSDQTWEALSCQFQECQLIELIVVIGYYRMIAYVLNSLRTPIEGQSSKEDPGDG
jgi:alkylhydroperoxidase family enzyme